MKVPVIKIGNSKGIRLSKTLIDKYKIRNNVNLIFEEGQIIIKPQNAPREGWEEHFKKMNKNKEDKLFINDVFEDEIWEE